MSISVKNATDSISPAIIRKKKDARSKDVMRCMLNVFKSQEIAVKHEKFIIAFEKTLTKIESTSEHCYLCFDYNAKETDKFISLLAENLAENQQDYTISKLGYILATAVGLYNYETLQTQLCIYQYLLETEWNFFGKRVKKPQVYKDQGKNLNVKVPFRDLRDNSRTANYIRHHTCYAKIQVIKEEFFIFMPFKSFFEYESLRNFSFSEKDATAWLISFCINEIGGVDIWNSYVTANRALDQIEHDRERWEEIKIKVRNKILNY